MSSNRGIMKGKVCLITGATSGIGKATVLDLAKMGATVVILSRDMSRGGIARWEIIEEAPNSDISVIIGDLGSLESIQNFVENFKELYTDLHVLINNAGVHTNRRIETVDGYEKMFAVNHLGHFFLTNLLLDIIKKSSPSRIINVASKAQQALDFNDLQSKEHFSMMKVYGRSKLANVIFSYELDRRLSGSGVTVNCLHPGFVRTNIGHDLPWIMRKGMNLVMKLAKSPEKGAETSIYLASSPEVANISGKYFVDKLVKTSTPASYDEETAKRLWEESETLVQAIIPDFSTSV